MTPNGDEFTVNVGKWVAQAQEHARVAFIAIGLEALSRVKELTPVDTGWLRSNWQIQREGEERPAMREALPSDPGRAAEMLKELQQEVDIEASADARGAMSKLGEAQLGETLRIINPVIYAAPVEFGRHIQKKDGSSVQTSGAAMVQQTVMELPEISREVVRQVRRRSP